MTQPTQRVILVEDSIDDADLLQMDLRDAGLNVLLQRVEDLSALQRALVEKPAPLAVVSDGNLPRFSGAHALQTVRAEAPSLPFAFFTGALDPRPEFAQARADADICLLKQEPDRLIAWLAALTAV